MKQFEVKTFAVLMLKMTVRQDLEKMVKEWRSTAVDTKDFLNRSNISGNGT